MELTLVAFVEDRDTSEPTSKVIASVKMDINDLPDILRDSIRREILELGVAISDGAHSTFDELPLDQVYFPDTAEQPTAASRPHMGDVLGGEDLPYAAPNEVTWPKPYAAHWGVSLERLPHIGSGQWDNVRVKLRAFRVPEDTITFVFGHPLHQTGPVEVQTFATEERALTFARQLSALGCDAAVAPATTEA